MKSENDGSEIHSNQMLKLNETPRSKSKSPPKVERLALETKIKPISKEQSEQISSKNLGGSSCDLRQSEQSSIDFQNNLIEIDTNGLQRKQIRERNKGMLSAVQEQSLDQEFDETLPIGDAELGDLVDEPASSDHSFLTEIGLEQQSKMSSAK